jgi:hypothetical protein
MAINPSFQFGFQGTADPNTCAVESPATLLIKHLPDAIPHDTLSRLLSHYGASSVRPCSSGRYHSPIHIVSSNSFLFTIYETLSHAPNTTTDTRRQ